MIRVVFNSKIIEWRAERQEKMSERNKDGVKNT
jgi:hypothetical protein